MRNNSRIICVLLVGLILFYSVNNSTTQVFSYDKDTEGNNWEYINHNVRGTNYSPQNQINADNVHMLELKWTYPIPAATEFNKQEGISLFNKVEKIRILYPDLQSKDTNSRPTNPDPPNIPIILSFIEFKNFYF